MARIHLIGVCGTAMATLAALLKSKGHDVRGSDQNVYPPMSDFLQQQGIATLQGYKAEHIKADIDLVVVGNAISRGNPELEEVLESEDSILFAARGHSRLLSVGRQIGRHYGDAWQNHHDVAHRVGPGARRLRPQRIHRRHRREFREQLPDRRRAGVRHRGRRVRQRLLRQDRQVPQVPARHRRRQQHRVRPCGYLPRPRIDPADLPAIRQPRPEAWAAAAGRGQRGNAGLEDARALPGPDVRVVRQRRLASARSENEPDIDVVHGAASGRRDRELRAAAARSVQRSKRARGGGRRSGDRPQHRHDA